MANQFEDFQKLGQANADLATKAINTSDPWQHTIPPRGGFVLRLDP